MATLELNIERPGYVSVSLPPCPDRLPALSLQPSLLLSSPRAPFCQPGSCSIPPSSTSSHSCVETTHTPMWLRWKARREARVLRKALCTKARFFERRQEAPSSPWWSRMVFPSPRVSGFSLTARFLIAGTISCTFLWLPLKNYWILLKIFTTFF